MIRLGLFSLWPLLSNVEIFNLHLVFVVDLIILICFKSIVVLAALAGLSRYYSSMHHLSDVGAGMSIGLFFGALGAVLPILLNGRLSIKDNCSTTNPYFQRLSPSSMKVF